MESDSHGSITLQQENCIDRQAKMPKSAAGSYTESKQFTNVHYLLLLNYRLAFCNFSSNSSGGV